jgi:hypothetical protein
MIARAPFQFGVRSLLLTITVFAVVRSSWKMNPALGTVLTIAAVCGVLGIWASLEDSARRGELLTYRQKLRAFFDCAALIIGSAFVLVVCVAILGSFWSLIK